jgi:vacuolar protein sorting-associated protein 53
MAPPSSSSGTKVILPPANAGPSVASDPKLLLEAFDKYTAASRRALSSSSSSPTTEQSKQPDPIAFLNKHFTTEETLVAQLPGIREAVTERMDLLDDRISGALQRQSETAEATQKHVQEAKASVASLEQRIRQVQQKAGQSETAVREITKDMKKLDLAKRHLQSTITTLKRLHMLIHAVEQLRLACLNQPFPDFQSAANLVDATRLLLRHFDGYMEKVEPMRLLSEKVSDLQGELRFSLVRGFRLVAFGVEKTIELEKITKQKSLNTEAKITQDSVVLMTPTVMAGGVLMIDSLGADVRKEFIHGICQDHLSEYNRLFNPVRKEVKKEQPRVSSFRAQPEAPKEELPENDLENIEKRFVWFRNFLHSFDKKFPDVFPVYWNLHAGLTRVFLRLVSNDLNERMWCN